MKINNNSIPRAVICALLCSIACSLTPLAHAEQTDLRLIEVATGVLRSNGMNSSPGVVAIVVNQENSKIFLNDSHVSPYILPIVKQQAWTSVVFIPEDMNTESVKVVYFNQHKLPVGVITGKKLSSYYDSDHPSDWRSAKLTTDNGVQFNAYLNSAVTPDDDKKKN